MTIVAKHTVIISFNTPGRHFIDLKCTITIYLCFESWGLGVSIHKLILFSCNIHSFRISLVDMGNAIVKKGTQIHEHLESLNNQNSDCLQMEWARQELTSFISFFCY